MANQRTSLKDRRALDAKGVDAIITATDALPEPVEEASQVQKPLPLAKMTVYVRPDQILALEEIQLAERKRTGRRKDKSDLVQEAFDLLIERHREAQ